MPNAIILPFQGIMPRIDPTAFIAAGAVIMGDVVIGAYSSVWPNCVIRGDMAPIRIGARTNVQDGSVIHVSLGMGTTVGDDVTIGHMALLHDCHIEDKAFIGMRATLLEGSRIESHGMIAANALLTSGKVIKARELWAGSPAKFFRHIAEDESVMLAKRAGEYMELADSYKERK